MVLYTFGRPIDNYQTERISFDEVSDRITKALASGANPNTYNSNGEITWVQFIDLLESDSDRTAKIEDWVDKFIEYGADIDKKNRRHIKPLYSCAFRQHPISFIYLMKRGASVEDHADNLLVEICGTESWDRSDDLLIVEAINMLVERGLDPCQPSKDGKRTAITEAARGGNIPVIESLLELGCDINQRTLNGGTALMYACGPIETNPSYCYNNQKDIETIDFLLKSGADPTYMSKQRRTAISIAKSWHRNEAERLNKILDTFKKYGY